MKLLDDKNHGVPDGPIAKKIKKCHEDSKNEPTHGELN